MARSQTQSAKLPPSIIEAAARKLGLDPSLGATTVIRAVIAELLGDPSLAGRPRRGRPPGIPQPAHMRGPRRKPHQLVCPDTPAELSPSTSTRTPEARSVP